MIKLLIGGSPCTFWSIAQKNNRETEAEGGGWELFKNYLVAKEKFKPDFFLYENNKSAAQAIKDQIKKELGVWDGTLFSEDSGARYIEINSALVSAQNRQRFYVHNCGEVEQPEDRGILLKDILESGQNLSQGDKAFALTTRCAGAIPEDTIQKHRHTMVAEPVIFQTPRGKNNGGCKYGKCPTLTANGSWQYNNRLIEHTKITKYENKHTVYEVKDGQITIKGKKYPIKLPDGFYNIRKLTVTECARLQTMPDDYCNYGRQILKQIFYKGNDEWKNVELKDVITKSQTVATDYATSIVYDCKDMEQRNSQEIKSIKVKNAKLTVAKDNVKAPRVTVICTTNDGKDMELSNCLKEVLKNAKFAVKLQFAKDCVQSIIKISKNTETQDILIIYEAVLTNKDIKNINTRITRLNIEPLQKECSVDDSQKMILSTILTLISQIMMKTTYTYAHKVNIVDYIMNLKSVQPNFIEWDLLSLRTDTTNLMSKQNAYKGLGNGWTAEVIIHILNGALKDIPKDEEIVVLSMYDGIGTGRYCLDKMGFTNVKYYAYEIDKYAKQIAMSNYPDIIQMGNAFDLRNTDWTIGY